MVCTEVGKSSLMLQLVEQRFQPEHEMTFGVECASYRMTVDNHLIDLEIWDTVRWDNTSGLFDASGLMVHLDDVGVR